MTIPQRPPSRSERLLRDALRRDEEIRDTGLASPPRSSGCHSRVASPPPPPLPILPTFDRCSRQSSPPPRCRYAELADEDYTQGAFLFRPAIANNANSPPQGYYPAKMDDMYERSPRALHTQRASGLTESSDGTATPGSRTRFSNGNGPHTPRYSSRLSTRSISPSPSPTKGAAVSRRHSLQRAFHHEPLTPQEHALRARLEGMLRLEDNRPSSHMTHPNTEWSPKEVRDGYGRDSNGRTRSGSLSQPQSAAFTWSAPPLSSQSLHSGSSSFLQDQPSLTHTRNRSSTDPVPSYSTSSRACSGTATNTTTLTASSSSTSMSSFSQRRNVVTSNHPQIHSHQQSRRKHVPIESTPPLTADASPTGISEGNELEPDYQLDADDNSRLITPPPSPPPHSSHHQPHSPSPYHPIGDWYPVYNAEVYTVNHGTPTPHYSKPVRSQFNVRKASEQCKLIDGYVSFVSIEGLGGPPESNSPALGEDEGEDENRNRDKRMFGIGWDRWKKLLPLAVGGTHGGHESAMMP